MRAIQITEFGGTDVLKLVEIPEPSLHSNEVLVDVYAASINPADSKMRRGLYQSDKNFAFPHVLGRDFSGIIKSCGKNITEFRPGDAVFGVLPTGREGTYIEKLTIDANLVTIKPHELEHNQAAAIALTGLTALVAVEDDLALKKGEKILIHGGAGGVGSYAIQLAHYIGAEVITTASPKNNEYLYNLGADHIIDYNTQDFRNYVSDVDAVFDLIGGEVHQRSFEVLKSGGRMAYIAPLTKDTKPPRNDVNVIRPNVKRDRAHLNRIVELFMLDAVSSTDIQVFPLSSVNEAHELIETNHVRGKLILSIK
jgi:NADPH:quinone reductase-like Zn-dependent oxidoreductase